MPNGGWNCWEIVRVCNERIGCTGQYAVPWGAVLLLKEWSRPWSHLRWVLASPQTTPVSVCSLSSFSSTRKSLHQMFFEFYPDDYFILYKRCVSLRVIQTLHPSLSRNNFNFHELYWCGEYNAALGLQKIHLWSCNETRTEYQSTDFFLIIQFEEREQASMPCFIVLWQLCFGSIDHMFWNSRNMSANFKLKFFQLLSLEKFR